MVLSLTYRTPEGAVQKNLGQDDQTLVPGSSVQSDMVCEFDQPLEKVYPLKWERRSGFPLCIDVECTQRQVAVVLESLAESFRVVATVNRVHLGKAVPELSRHGAISFPPPRRKSVRLIPCIWRKSQRRNFRRCLTACRGQPQECCFSSHYG